MAITIPNKVKLSLESPKLGEALDTVEQYLNTNVTPVAGNRKPAPPPFINPAQRPG